MQLDMHFYGVYALARAAGIKPETARLIAYASQFVDDAIEDEAVILKEGKAVLPTMTSHKPLDYKNAIAGDQWKVWIPFHFLPGNKDKTGSFLEKMICQKGQKENLPAQKILDYALEHKKEPFGIHLVGIVAHVYADTFSHYGFVGLSSHRNKVKADSIQIHSSSSSIRRYIESKLEVFKSRLMGSMAEVIPVGHGAVGTLPDRPYLSWEYEYEFSGERVERNNYEDFKEACQGLYEFFKNFLENNPQHKASESPKSWEEIEEKIQSILVKEAPLEERIEEWRKAINSGDLFSPREEDKKIYYSSRLWDAAHIVYHFEQSGSIADCNPCLFFKAAWNYRQFVLQRLLPEMKILV